MSAVQRKANGDDETGSIHDAAAHGIQGGGCALPHLETIQRSFGRHDVSGITAHQGANANAATERMGAAAYATGNNVVFGAGRATLHTAAHEAAHAVQQRAGVSLLGGVGEVGDPYERHADAVADAVVAGQSAEAILDATPGGSLSAGGHVQRAPTVQRQETPTAPESGEDMPALLDRIVGEARGDWSKRNKVDPSKFNDPNVGLGGSGECGPFAARTIADLEKSKIKGAEIIPHTTEANKEAKKSNRAGHEDEPATNPSVKESKFAGAKASNDHRFAVVKMPDGKVYLVDPTFGQFADGETGKTFRAEAPEAEAQLRERGWVVLTKEIAAAHGRALTGDPNSRIELSDYQTASQTKTDLEKYKKRAEIAVPGEVSTAPKSAGNEADTAKPAPSPGKPAPTTPDDAPKSAKPGQPADVADPTKTKSPSETDEAPKSAKPDEAGTKTKQPDGAATASKPEDDFNNKKADLLVNVATLNAEIKDLEARAKTPEEKAAVEKLKTRNAAQEEAIKKTTFDPDTHNTDADPLHKLYIQESSLHKEVEVSSKKPTTPSHTDDADPKKVTHADDATPKQATSTHDDTAPKPAPQQDTAAPKPQPVTTTAPTPRSAPATDTTATVPTRSVPTVGTVDVPTTEPTPHKEVPVDVPPPTKATTSDTDGPQKTPTTTESDGPNPQETTDPNKKKPSKHGTDVDLTDIDQGKLGVGHSCSLAQVSKNLPIIGGAASGSGAGIWVNLNASLSAIVSGNIEKKPGSEKWQSEVKGGLSGSAGASINAGVQIDEGPVNVTAKVSGEVNLTAEAVAKVNVSGVGSEWKVDGLASGVEATLTGSAGLYATLEAGVGTFKVGDKYKIVDPYTLPLAKAGWTVDGKGTDPQLTAEAKALPAKIAAGVKEFGNVLENAYKAGKEAVTDVVDAGTGLTEKRAKEDTERKITKMEFDHGSEGWKNVKANIGFYELKGQMKPWEIEKIDNLGAEYKEEFSTHYSNQDTRSYQLEKIKQRAVEVIKDVRQRLANPDGLSGIGEGGGMISMDPLARSDKAPRTKEEKKKEEDTQLQKRRSELKYKVGRLAEAHANLQTAALKAKERRVGAERYHSLFDPDNNAYITLYNKATALADLASAGIDDLRACEESVVQLRTSMEANTKKIGSL